VTRWNGGGSGNILRIPSLLYSSNVDENLVSEGVRYLSTFDYRFDFFFYPVCSHSESKCRIAVWASAARLYLNMQNGVPEPPPPDN
jgi:hypothetical protein